MRIRQLDGSDQPIAQFLGETAFQDQGDGGVAEVVQQAAQGHEDRRPGQQGQHHESTQERSGRHGQGSGHAPGAKVGQGRDQGEGQGEMTGPASQEDQGAGNRHDGQDDQPRNQLQSVFRLSVPGDRPGHEARHEHEQHFGQGGQSLALGP